MGTLLTGIPLCAAAVVADHALAWARWVDHGVVGAKAEAGT